VRRLVDDVVPAAELLPRALALAGELAARSLVSFAASKRALRADGLARIAAARAGGEDPIWAVWRAPETRAAIEAFAARAIGRPSRPPATRPPPRAPRARTGRPARRRRRPPPPSG